MSKVVIIAKLLPHYRVTFFDLLAEALDKKGVELVVYHGPEEPSSSPVSVGPNKLKVAQEKWINITYCKFRFIYQQIPRSVFSSDLIVISQSNRLVFNHFLMARRFLGIKNPKIAFWGHGKNFQAHPFSLSEYFKKVIRQYVDYWFCYTEAVARSLEEIPSYKKISVQNSIDTKKLQEEIKLLPDIKDSKNLLFIGSMREDKRFEWIFSALLKAKEADPKVTATFVGGGPEENKVRHFADKYSWVDYVGEVTGRDVAFYLKRSGAIIMPGLVGLVVLDSFVSGSPILTTHFHHKHSPEFDYLTQNNNALVSDDNIESYSEMVAEYVRDSELQNKLRANCIDSIKLYSLEAMVERFVLGIAQALELK